MQGNKCFRMQTTVFVPAIYYVLRPYTSVRFEGILRRQSILHDTSVRQSVPLDIRRTYILLYMHKRGIAIVFIGANTKPEVTLSSAAGMKK